MSNFSGCIIAHKCQKSSHGYRRVKGGHLCIQITIQPSNDWMHVSYMFLQSFIRVAIAEKKSPTMKMSKWQVKASVVRTHFHQLCKTQFAQQEIDVKQWSMFEGHKHQSTPNAYLTGLLQHPVIHHACLTRCSLCFLNYLCTLSYMVMVICVKSSRTLMLVIP